MEENSAVWPNAGLVNVTTGSGVRHLQLPPGLRRLKAKAFLVNVVINTVLYRGILTL
jgi:hypothetical protein